MSRRATEVGAMSAAYIQSDDVEPGTVKVHILIVSDIRLYREALASRLAENDRFAIVGSVGRYAAVREVNRYEPDLVLLDVGEWHGLDLATTLLAKRPKLGILAIAVPEISGSAIAAMLGGFAGFVPRDGSLEDVISELDRVAAVGRNEPITVVAPPLLQPNASEPIFAPRSRVGELTPRECEILEMIELGLSNKEIARKLRIEVGTVKNHVHNILDKMNVRRRNQAAHRVRVRGWAQDEEQ
jgi:two-component system, NarL family, nitrate/nitrite response regulator NarL